MHSHLQVERNGESPVLTSYEAPARAKKFLRAKNLFPFGFILLLRLRPLPNEKTSFNWKINIKLKSCTPILKLEHKFALIRTFTTTKGRQLSEGKTLPGRERFAGRCWVWGGKFFASQSSREWSGAGLRWIFNFALRVCPRSEARKGLKSTKRPVIDRKCQRLITPISEYKENLMMMIAVKLEAFNLKRFGSTHWWGWGWRGQRKGKRKTFKARGLS